MKTRTKALIIAAAAGLATALHGLPLQGPDLDIGSNPAPTHPSDQSASIGTNNRAYWRSLAAGSSNRANDNSLVAGAGNETSDLSAAVGQGNLVNMGTAAHPVEGIQARRSLAVGYVNVVEAFDSAAVGRNNAVEARMATALGMGLTNTTDMATVVGAYNEDKPGVRFAVGDGADENSKSNALEVYDDGRVVMKKQGDIKMGAFGLNGD